MRKVGSRPRRVYVGLSKLGTLSGASIRKGTKGPNSLEVVSVSQFWAITRKVVGYLGASGKALL